MASASSYQTIFMLRALLGIAQAVTNPTSLSLIAELFPEARATVSSAFGLGIYLGGGLASLGAFLDGRVGWRSCCLLFGLISASVALPALAVDDPRPPQPQRLLADGAAVAASADAGGSDGHVVGVSCSGESPLSRLSPTVLVAAQGAGRRVAEAVGPATARWLFLASTMRFCAGFAILVWLPVAVHERFPLEGERFAVYNALIKVFAGGASSLAGGAAADALKSRGLGDRAGALFCAASSLLAAPLWCAVLVDGLSFEASMFFLLVEYLVAESWLGPALATLQDAVPPSRRGTAQGVFSALTALGSALPAVLGLLPKSSLAQGLQVSVALCYVCCAGCFAVAARCLPPGGS
jgi:MFS family permease